MPNNNLYSDLKTGNVDKLISAGKEYLSSDDWRGLEYLSLLLKQHNSPSKSSFFYRKAEDAFLSHHPKIKKDKLLFNDIDWDDYASFYPKLKQANYTKLRAIKHLYTSGIAEGKLGKYLIYKGKVRVGIIFLILKILEYPQQELFYAGYLKLLKYIYQDNNQEQINFIEQINFENLFAEIQLKVANKKQTKKAQELSQAKIKLQWLHHQAKYSAKLKEADCLAQNDVKQSKAANDLVEYPKPGEKSAEDIVIAGRQRWFFLYAGSNDVIKYHTGAKQLSSLEIEQWDKLLQTRTAWHKTRKIEYQHLFAPNKIAIYPEHYPQNLSVKRDRPILQLQQKCRQSFLYSDDLLIAQKKNYRLYNKQDCHWSFWGCYFTYILVCQSLGIEPNYQLLNSDLTIKHKKGDLGGKFGLKERLLRMNLIFNSRVIYDNKVINHCHQGSIRILKNSHVSQGKMIIFGDSFSNPGHPNYRGKNRLAARLSNMLAETLNEVHFVWTPWVDYDYIEQEKPDFVLTEMSERFCVRVPDDINHLPLEEFAAMKLKKYQSK